MSRVNGLIRELHSGYTLNDLLHEALSPIGMPCSEEPTNCTDEAQSYITWAVTGTRRLTASGETLHTTYYIAVTLQALKNAEHLTLVRDIASRLQGAGCVYATPGAEAWNAETGRRQCAVNCALRTREADA